MEYKKKLKILLSAAGSLSLIYAATFVFSPQRADSRDAFFSWIDGRERGRIEAIVIEGAQGTVELAAFGGGWFVVREGVLYPAHSFRVEDLLDALTVRASFPLRARAAASHGRLGVSEDVAFAIRAFSGGEPVLELLVGYTDMTGRAVYLRRAGQNEVRSGDLRFLAFSQSPIQFWYNLRLIPESASGALDIDRVQRMIVYSGGGAAQVFTRQGHQWVLSGGAAAVYDPDTAAVNAHIRSVLMLEADDFARAASPESAAFDHGRITLELGDGSSRTIRLTEADSQGRRLAAVSFGNEPAGFVYELSPWAAGRLFADLAEFERAAF